MEQYYPLITLAVGVATVIGMIMVLRINAFIALITAAIVVSLMAPGEMAEKISRVAAAFGTTAGKIGIVIALAAVIGECMMASGAADRIVQFFVQILGEKRAAWALMLSGFVLSIPVFFDTVFYLLVPLARSLYKRTGKNYLLYLLAIAGGGAITHTLVPPTPGPLTMAAELHFDVGMMILVGALVGMPAAIVGLLISPIMDRKLQVPFREVGPTDESPLEETQVPSLGLSLLPVILPVIMISANTVVGTILKGADPAPFWSAVAPYTAVIGNANLAMLASAAVAMLLVVKVRGSNKQEMSRMVETSLMSGGVIILITSGGGAFGAMLQAANIGDAVKSLFSGEAANSGMMYLVLSYVIASLMKFAQGSGTVAMVTTSGMIYAMFNVPKDLIDTTEGYDLIVQTLGFHPVYLATAIGAGSLMGSWMNDSGFWIFTKMGGLTEAESLKSWTVLLAILSVVSMAVTVILAIAVPMV